MIVEATKTETIDDRVNMINSIVQGKPDSWFIAALVDGSIGYHTVDHAERIIQRFRDGETIDYCERCAACYGADLTLMLTHDVVRFSRIEESRQNAVIEYVESMRNRDYMDQLTGSMLYPDHRPR